MSDYKIITDSGCDLPRQMFNQLGVHAVPLFVNYKGEEQEDSVDEGVQEMYEGLRAGEVATTSAINPDRWARAMEEALAEGLDVLTITFSSGLSTTYQSAVIAGEELKEKYPDRKICVVDGLSASMGQGLLVWYACQKKAEGLSVEELAAWVESNRLNLCHWVTVDDLMYLKRGGRVSATTAVVGTMLQIKPIIHVNDEGKLINVGKARGRKGALSTLLQKVQELGEGFDNSTMFISHGDCLEDAQYMASQLKEKCGVKEVIIGYIGAVIGSHAGPGTLAIFFMGKHR